MNPGPSGWRYRKGVVPQPELSADPALSRRAALTLALGGAVGALSGCAQADDPECMPRADARSAHCCAHEWGDLTQSLS